MSDQFTGHGGAADHRTTGDRAWCHGCTEWCYPDEPCGQPRCCTETVGDSAVERLRAESDDLRKTIRRLSEALHATEAIVAERDTLLPVVEAAREMVKRRNEHYGRPDNPDWWQGWDFRLVAAVDALQLTEGAQP